MTTSSECALALAQPHDSKLAKRQHTQSEGFQNSQEQKRAAAIAWTRDDQKAQLRQWGCPPIPVVPVQDRHKYPLKDKRGRIIYEADGVTPKRRFNGKNPSYFDEVGEPQLIKHSAYVEAAVTPEQEAKWFQDERVGIGTLAGTGTGTPINWLDWDAKDFDSIEESDREFQKFCELNNLSDNWLTQTQGGGYRVPVRGVKKDFTNFSIKKGSKRKRGEFLGRGRFLVLAPTIGPSGNNYSLIRNGKIPVVSKLKGIYSAKSKADATVDTGERSNTSEKLKLPSDSQLVSLSDLISAKSLQHLGGDKGHRKSNSDALGSLASDLYGWENFCETEGYITDDAEDYVARAAENFGYSSDDANRKLVELRAKRESLLPNLHYAGQGWTDKARAILQKALNGGRKRDESIYIASEDTPGIVAERELYPDLGNWMKIQGQIYHFNGVYCERRDHAVERSRIARLFKRTYKVEMTREGPVRSRPYAKSNAVKDAFEYCLDIFRTVQPDEVSPSGTVNCTNGTLLLKWEEKTLIPTLVPHTPKYVFTEKPRVKYDPNADTEDCDRLLKVLSPEQMGPYLQTISSALDLPFVRKHCGRSAARIVFCVGEGSNGKDAVKDITALIFGRSSITSCSISDFGDYHNGRKFNLSPLAGSRANWASENDVNARIDRIEPLKNAATGEELICEKKHKDGIPFDPRAVLLFNTNGIPNLVAKQEAIKSRYAIFSFDKVFVSKPSRPNELKADPRFKYDPDWVAQNVAPAFLNVLLEKIQKTVSDGGIDYSACDETLESNMEEASHLYRFLQEGSIETDPDGCLPSDAIWQELLKWYVEEGSAAKTPDGAIEVSREDPRPGDRLVRGKNQLARRLRDFVPNLKTGKPSSGEFAGQRCIYGLSFRKATPEQAPGQLQQTPQQPQIEQTELNTGHSLNFLPEDYEEEPLNDQQKARFLSQVMATAKNEKEFEVAIEGKSSEEVNNAWGCLNDGDRLRLSEFTKQIQDKKASG